MTAMTQDEATVDLDGVLWQMWNTMDVPEGWRAEIIEGAIEVSPTGCRRHAIVVNRLRRALDSYLVDSGFAAYQDGNVLHGRKVFIPDLFIAPADLDEVPDAGGLGVDVSGVALIMEMVSPGQDGIQRDRVRKRRAYARAGIPVYVIVDDFDGDGTVTVLSAPNPGRAGYAAETRMPYGTPVAVPAGPAMGFEIGAEITGKPVV